LLRETTRRGNMAIQVSARGHDGAATRAGEWPVIATLPRAPIGSWGSAVVIAAHPADEVLGVGGTMSLLAAAGTRLRLVVVTDIYFPVYGQGDSPPRAGRPAAQTSGALTAQALRVLGAQHTEVVRLGLPGPALVWREDELTAVLAGLTEGFDACLAPWLRDVRGGHEAVARAARRACPGSLGYPVWMWHWARPGDQRVPWHRAERVPLPPSAAAAKRAAVRALAERLPGGQRSGPPALTAAVAESFLRSDELLFR
jgi:LmbE family N-acetylglucosaminyl deacetylase